LLYNERDGEKEFGMSIEALMQEIRTLPVEDRKQLITLIVDTLTESEQPEKKHSLLELEGLGKEIWEGVDAKEYVNELRREWDHRP
jgi:hypothetical protein